MNTGFHLKEKDVYRLVHVVLLLCMGLFGAGNRLGIDDLSLLHFLTALCIIALITGMQLMTIKGRLLCLLSIIAFVFITGMIVGAQNVFDFFTSYYGWLTGGRGTEEWRVGYELLQAVAVAAFCCFFAALLEKYFYLKFILACLLICILLFCLLTGTFVSHKGVTCIFCYIAVVYAEWVQFCWKKVRNKNREANILWLMPFIAAYLLLMIWMPAPEEPYGWQFVKDMCSQLKESFLSLSQNIMRSGEEDFDTALSGFTESGELHGDIEEDAREIMTIWSTDSLVTNIYLTGRIYDTFDGRQWQQRNHDTEPERFLDTVQTRYAVQKFGEKTSWNYLSRTTITIQYQYFNTSYLFAPVKAESLRVDREPVLLLWDGGSMLFPDTDQKKGYGTEYDVSYFQMNTGAEDFDLLLTAGWEENFETDVHDADLEALLQESGEKTGTNMTPEDLENHVRKIYDVYSEEVILSDALQNYLDDITKDAENAVEKLRLIEAELSSYTYTQNPDRLPDTVTDAGGFLDYFLLESREGYCTYFATAFTLLARAEGIPARYVQGFCIPADGGGERTVYSDMAHSWPEVYLDNIGWVPFEPTPGYTRLRYTPWQTEQASTGEEASAAIVSHHEIGPIEETETVEGDFSQINPEWTGDRTSIRNFLWIIVYTVLTVLAIGFLLLALEYIVRKQRYRKMTSFQRFQTEVFENLRILSWIGLRRSVGETLQEFRNRAETALKGDGKEGPSLRFIENYEAVLYGGKEAAEEMITAARQERTFLLGALKRKKKRTYFYYRIRFSFTFLYK